MTRCNEALSIDVIALQEVYADATTQRQVSKRLRERGWFVFWVELLQPTPVTTVKVMCPVLRSWFGIIWLPARLI